MLDKINVLCYSVKQNKTVHFFMKGEIKYGSKI